MSYNKLANVQYSRLKNKIISGVGEEPTIPIIATAFAGVTEEDYMVLNQFTPNDVLDGEFVINTTDDRIWVRSDDSILEVMTSASVALPSLTNNHIWIGDNGTASEYALGAGFTVSGATISIDANYDNLYIESTGLYSTIRKDVGHSSTGDHSVISGGCCNTINGVTNASSILGGGQHVIATASYSSILGGASNDMLNNIYGVIGGGAANSLFNSCSSTILNGTNNRLLSGTYSHISNGGLNTAYGCHNVIGNGNNNTVSGEYSSIGNGVQNKLDNSPFSTVLNGAQNTISSSYFSSVIAGNNSKIYNSSYSFILGGNNNTTSGYFNVIPGGTLNTVEGSFSRAQGSTNKIFSDYSTADGFNNQVNGAFSSVNGSTNVINSNFSSIRGTNNTVSSNYTHVLGNGITATYSNHTYVNNLIIEETPNVNDEENTNILVRNTLTGQIETSTFSSTSMTRETNYLIKNQTGSTLLKGKVVRADGTLGSSGRILGDYMIADGTIPAKFTLGIVKNNILNGEDGYVAEFGLIKGIDTTGTPYGEVWNDGDVLWASPTASGGLTNQEPLTPNLHIEMAIVINASNNGSIFVRPHRYPYSYDLQDMGWTASSQKDKDIIQYDSTLGYFTLTNTPEFDSISAATISATAFYGDGSNLTGISAPSLYTQDDTIGSGRVATLTDTLSFKNSLGITNFEFKNGSTGIKGDNLSISSTNVVDSALNIKYESSTNTGLIIPIGVGGSGTGKLNISSTQTVIGNIHTINNVKIGGNSVAVGGTRSIEIPFGTDYNWKGINMLATQVSGGGADFEIQTSPGGLGGTYVNALKLFRNGSAELNKTSVYGFDTLSTSTAFEIYDGDTTPAKLWDFRNNGDLIGSGTRITNTIVNPTVQETTSTATFTINANTEISGIISAQAVALTIANPTGTPVQDQKLKFRIKDNGTARAITWGTNFRAIGVTLPTTTTASKVLVVGCFWNSNDSKWDVIAVNEEA